MPVVKNDKELRYRRLLEQKTLLLHEGLERIGCSHLKPRILSSALGEGFRSRAKFKIFTRPGGIRFMAKDPVRGEVTVEDMLWILPRWARVLPLRIRTILNAAFNHFPVDGFELKLSQGLREAHLTLSVKKGECRDYAPLAEELMARVTEVMGVAVPSRRSTFGENFVRHRIRGREFAAHYGAFFQSHPDLTPRLLDEAEKLIGGRKGSGWVDLYCGVGLLSLSLASPESRILGVDSNRKAVESADRNASHLGFVQARFVYARMESYPFQEMEIGPEDVVLINPPRSGCPEAVIRTVADPTPRVVCLVSCFPDTHFRDLEIWQALGYAVENMAALDTFPFTPFLETVTLLARKSS